MQNTFFQKRKPRYFLLLSFLTGMLTLVVYSCKKDSHSSSAATTDTYDVTEYKNLYSQALTAPKSLAMHWGNSSTPSTSSSISLIHGSQVDWNTNYIYKRTDGSIVAEFNNHQ